MAYADLDQLAVDEQFVQKLTFALADTLKTKYLANPTLTGLDGAVVGYVGPRTDDFKRAAREIAALVLVVNPSLTLDSTDAQVLTAVGTAWTPFGNMLVKRGLIEVA